MASIGSESVEVVPDARGFAEKLRAQLKDLPQIKITVNTTEAEMKVNELRLRLDDLRNERVRLTVDSGDAGAKVAELKAEIDSIHDKHVNIDDGGSANSLSGRIRGVADSADSAAAGTIARFTLIGVAIAAIIPLAAAASIAIAGIGAGIGLGILGALVGKLALGGVGSALSASNTPSVGSGTSQAQALDNQRQAEVALTVAQRNAVQAQQALTQARIDAVQTLQDLSNQVTDNGLAQRQAVLDLQTATQNLATAKASPDAQNPANAGALAQVQLAFDQAKQNLTELQEKGQFLSTQQASAVAAGVDGAASVVSAQNAVTDSQNALTEAQFNATHSTAAAAGSLTAYQKAMQKLDPVQQQFVKFLQSIKPAFDGIKNAAADSFLPKLQTAISDLLPVLPQIAGIVSKIGGAFGDLAIDASKFFTSPDGQKFLTFVQNTLGPAIDTFGKIFGGLFTTLGASVFEQAYPLIQEFGQALAGALGSANGGVAGGALGGFFAFIQANAPQIESTLETVAGALVSIFKSLAPLAGPALKAISDLATQLAGIVKIAAPVVKVLLPFAPEIILLVAAFKLLYTPIKAIIALLPIFDAEADANPAGAIVLAVAALVVGLTELIIHFKEVSAFLGGPLGTAIAVALVAFAPFIGIPALIIGHWQGLEQFFDGIKTGISGAKDWVGARVSDIVQFFIGLPDRISTFMSGAFNSVISEATSAAKAALNGVIGALDDAITFINSKLIDTANQVPFVNIPHIPQIPHLALGGLIGGNGGPTADNQLILASPGEFMLTAAAYSKYPDLAEAMNSGKPINTGNQITQIINPAAGLDEVGIAALVGRRLSFAGA